MNKVVAKGLALVLLVPVLLCAFSACSLGSMPSKTSSVPGSASGAAEEGSSTNGSEMESSGQSGEGSESRVEVIDPNDPAANMRSIADGYMAVLQEGHQDRTAELFEQRINEILPSTYDCDAEVYHAIWSKMSYTYGGLVTTDNVNYDLAVTCEIPDFRGCVDTILMDETAMTYVTQEWLLSIEDPQKEVEAYANMWNAILLAAAQMIEGGTYTVKIPYSDSFSFHDNGGGDWVCTKTPDIVRLCSRDNYMLRLTYLDAISIYTLVETYGAKLVEQGQMTQTAYEAALEKKKEAVLNAG